MRRGVLDRCGEGPRGSLGIRGERLEFQDGEMARRESELMPRMLVLAFIAGIGSNVTSGGSSDTGQRCGCVHVLVRFLYNCAVNVRTGCPSVQTATVVARSSSFGEEPVLLPDKREYTDTARAAQR